MCFAKQKKETGKLRRRRGFGGRDDGRLIFGSESGSAAVIGRWNFSGIYYGTLAMVMATVMLRN